MFIFIPFGIEKDIVYLNHHVLEPVLVLLLILCRQTVAGAGMNTKKSVIHYLHRIITTLYSCEYIDFLYHDYEMIIPHLAWVAIPQPVGDKRNGAGYHF